RGYPIGVEDDIYSALTQVEQHRTRRSDNLVTPSPEQEGQESRQTMTISECLKKAGGSVWESNPPSRGLAPITGFEVQAAHQHRYASSLFFNGLWGGSLPCSFLVRIVSDFFA